MLSADARGTWSEIESRLRPYVARRVPSAADAEDLLQEIFFRIHRGQDSLRDGERFGGWVYRVAQNVIADFARARARDPLVRMAEIGTSIDDSDDRDDGAQLEADLSECVALFAARLPSPYREAVTLTELQELSQKEAAEMLGVSLSAMKSRVQRGRERIRRMFEECCEISLDCRGRIVECESRALENVPEDCRAAAAAWAARPRR